ncbi:hypothetical protein [Nodosilinea sp. E11]|uniref:hypothetical protein n=1 Tax=Nodosilinea sp. E11 TaxID=3037479 RepID=UPI00293486B2|nr:hypothetical protein [Nodosilinea sp. E11]WOD37647.1 hypothetical protein RRF56_15670 [Nodosilinea sp. E11]
MEHSVGAWMALKCALNPGTMGILVLTTAGSSLVLPAWGSELPTEALGTNAQLAETQLAETQLAPTQGAIDGIELALSKPGSEKFSPDLGMVQGRPLWPTSAALVRSSGVVLALEAVVSDAVSPAEGEAAASVTPEGPAPERLTLESGNLDGVVPVMLTDAEPATAIAQEPMLEAESGLAPAERSEVFVQAAYLQQGDAGSARLRGGGIYVLSPSVFAGVTADLSTGQAFSDNDQTGFSLGELYLTASPANLPELRFTVGLMDLTAYLDRNSFAKDSLTHFFNPVFQTNPALSTVNVASRPGALVNWTPVDAVSLTATTFSANRGLGNFALDSFAGEVGVRFGNAIVRGTYVTSPDTGRGDGLAESFSIDRGNGQFGPLPGDRETGFGLNAEAFIPGLNLGLFGRYGWYTNQALGVSGQTYSFGANGLDVFLPGDRLGLGYGRQLSNDALRQSSGGPVPDVWELFYDAQIVDNLRAGVSVQQRNAFTETYLGFRVRYDLRWNPLRRAAE